MKKWVDAGEIKMVHELPKELREFDKEMKITPSEYKNKKIKGEIGCFKNGKKKETSQAYKK